MAQNHYYNYYAVAVRAPPPRRARRNASASMYEPYYGARLGARLVLDVGYG